MIAIVEHQANWAKIVAEWTRRLGAEFTSERVSVTPIGAAAIAELAGRDEVDLLVCVRDPAERLHIVDSLLAQRFDRERTAWSSDSDWLIHVDEQGERVRLLITQDQSPTAADALAIVQQLAGDRLVSSAFVQLKRAVAQECGGDVARYEKGKQQFLREVLNVARAACAQQR